MKKIKFQISKTISVYFLRLITLNRLQVWINNFLARKTFKFNNYDLNYFFHSYNNFGITERSIEIPIIKSYLSSIKYNQVLEIGNVTKHYYDEFKSFINKETLDKYETAFDVINLDIKDYNPNLNFDFIFSISTFEHMDTDGGRNSDYFEDHGIFRSNAFNYLDKVYKNLLKSGGKLVITFPLSYCNDEIANSFLNGDIEKISPTNYSYFIYKKISETEWQNISLDNYLINSNNNLFPNVNYLVVLELDK